MYKAKIIQSILLTLLVMFSIGQFADAAVLFQKPPDIDGEDTDGDGDPDNDHVFMHVTAGDGFTKMADGRLMYTFGFHDVTNLADPNNAIMAGMLAAEFPSPTIVVREGQKLYLTLTNAGMVIRPDLFDPHTVHWHGFPQASSIFDGVPSASISVNMMASLTYFYNVVEPGTYMWHCHVEATEHMQMGMLCQLYVEPIQNITGAGGYGSQEATFAYNDGDASTVYDVGYPIQIASFDPDFHDASLFVQPLPFSAMTDKYPMFNGRGYPDTVDPNAIWNTAADEGYADVNRPSQPISSLIEAEVGQKILLRISSLSTTSYHTVRVLGIPMQVVGTGARILRGTAVTDEVTQNVDLYYETSAVTLGGGESADVILNTADVEPGTYFLYATNLDHLSNNQEDFGGMMTEIVITQP